TDNISNAKLAETLGLTEHELCQSAVSAKSLPFVLALRCCGTDKVNFLFQKRGLPSRRFEAARFLADAFLTPLDDPCLLQTHTRRVRKQTQGVFAVELLAPIAALCDVLEGDFSAEAIDEAADHFGISPVAAQLHLQNNAAADFATAA